MIRTVKLQWRFEVMDLQLYPSSVLRGSCKTVESITPEIQKSLDEMMDKMDAWGGVGLAAPQCGLSLRMFVMHIPGHGRRAFVNPELEDLQEGLYSMEEGCLSLPGALIEVTRPSSVRLRALDHHGVSVDLCCRGLVSVCAQHENDHLDGVLILDKADSINRRAALQSVWDSVHHQVH